MKKEYTQLAQNIRTLRKSFKLSQEELALILDLSAQSAVSQYESDKRVPEPEIIKKLSDLFHITEDELKYEKIPPINFTQTQNRRESIQQQANVMFPIISPDDTENDEDLKKAYRLHVKIKKQAENDESVFETEIETCQELYCSAIDNNRSPIAAANLLWFILLDEVKRVNANKVEVMKRYYSSKKPISPSDYFDVAKEDGIYEDKEDDYSDTIYYLIDIMKDNRTTSELADYYIALRYIVGNVRNGRSPAVNKLVGGEMLISLEKCGNPYAVDALKKMAIFL